MISSLNSIIFRCIYSLIYIVLESKFNLRYKGPESTNEIIHQVIEINDKELDKEIQDISKEKEEEVENLKINSVDPEKISPYTSPFILIRHLVSTNAITFLSRYEPRDIILYNPNLSLIRSIELFQSLNPSIELSIHFLIYKESVEEQKYLLSIRKEKDSFEKLIKEKASIALISETNYSEDFDFSDASKELIKNKVLFIVILI